MLSDKGINLQSNELIRHNLVVFSNGEQALQVLPGLVDSIPEARLNLVSCWCWHLCLCYGSGCLTRDGCVFGVVELCVGMWW